DRLALLGKVVFPGPLGFGDAGVPLVLVVLAFELTEFIAQAGGFVAILLRLEAELGRRDAVNRIENLCDGIFLALARMVEFVGLIFLDRKSTRLNSSHVSISYAVFCLKKKKK